MLKINWFASPSLRIYAACVTRRHRGQKTHIKRRQTRTSEGDAAKRKKQFNAEERRGSGRGMEGGREMEWKERKWEEDVQRHRARERECERISSQIGLGQFVVTKLKKKKQEKKKGKCFLARQQEMMFGRHIHATGYCSYADTKAHAHKRTPHTANAHVTSHDLSAF